MVIADLIFQTWLFERLTCFDNRKKVTISNKYLRFFFTFKILFYNAYFNTSKLLTNWRKCANPEPSAVKIWKWKWIFNRAMQHMYPEYTQGIYLQNKTFYSFKMTRIMTAANLKWQSLQCDLITIRMHCFGAAKKTPDRDSACFALIIYCILH